MRRLDAAVSGVRGEGRLVPRMRPTFISQNVFINKF